MLSRVRCALAQFHARWWDTNNSKTPLSVFAHPDDGGGALPFTPKAVTHTVWVLLIKNGLKALPHCFADKPEYAGGACHAHAPRRPTQRACAAPCGGTPRVGDLALAAAPRRLTTPPHLATSPLLLTSAPDLCS
jgi:hypothetical protein